MSELDLMALVINNQRAIVCKACCFAKLSEKQVQRLIQKAFPELIRRKNGRILFIPYACRRSNADDLDRQMRALRHTHHWEEDPFVAISINDDESRAPCDTRAVAL